MPAVNRILGQNEVLAIVLAVITNLLTGECYNRSILVILFDRTSSNNQHARVPAGKESIIERTLLYTG